MNFDLTLFIHVLNVTMSFFFGLLLTPSVMIQVMAKVLQEDLLNL